MQCTTMLNISNLKSNAFHNYALDKKINSNAWNNYAYYKQFNTNALHNYAYHKQCIAQLCLS